MLGKNYKLHIVNNTGVQIDFSTDGANNTFTVTGIGWKFGTDGVLEYSAELTLFADPTADLANLGTVEAATAMDNSTNLYLGVNCTAALLTDAATDGTLDIYYEDSSDGGTTYPSDANDADIEEDLIHVGSINCGTTTEDRTINFSI